ncbi:MAG: helix-turn-helix domain-containing protein [Muribaculaceae bacterium]|nr:helix-turn-helix domain-containing protein [Muribaculaceae bacterium]
MCYSGKKSRKEISQTIGVSESTLSREIKRNSGQRGLRCLNK